MKFNKFIKYFVASSILLLTIVCVGMGRLVDDERAMFQFLNEYASLKCNLIDYFRYVAAHGGRPYLSHHLFWFFMLFLPFKVVSALLTCMGTLIPSSINRNLIIEWFLSYDQVVMIWLAILTSYLYVKKYITQKNCLSFVIISLFWLCSYGVDFIKGGKIECTLCLIVVLRLFVLEKKWDNTLMQVLILAMFDFLMVSVKLYAIIFCILTAFYFIRYKCPSWKQYYSIYMLLILIFTALLLLIKYEITPHEITSWYIGLIDIFKIRLVEQLLSFGYGLIWTAPALLLLFWSNLGERKEILFKLVSIMALLLFFGLFSFWHSADVGQRYMLPFLLALLPNVARAFLNLTKKHAILVFLVPLVAMLFFPIIEYRNGSVVRIPFAKNVSTDSGRSIVFDYEKLPLFDPMFHPAVFAWRVQLAKIRNDKTFNFKLTDGTYSVPVDDIFPMTFVSRAIYLKQNADKPFINPEYYVAIKQLPNYLFESFYVLRFVLVLFWGAILMVSTYCSYELLRREH